MSRFGDIAIGILVGASGLAGLSYLCSDDFKGFGDSDDGDDDEITIKQSEDVESREEVEPTEEDEELEEEAAVESV